MKIITEYNNIQSDLIEIKSANYVGHFKIQISFNDGIKKTIDFKQFLESSIHPAIRKYNDEQLFSKFDIVNGNLNWNDYDLIFPLEDLHKGKI